MGSSLPLFASHKLITAEVWVSSEAERPLVNSIQWTALAIHVEKVAFFVEVETCKENSGLRLD